MFTIMPVGGLCNRLYALHSAIRLSADLGQPLRMIWRVNDEIGCRLEDVITPPPEIGRTLSLDRLNRSPLGALRDALLRARQWPPIGTAIGPRTIEAWVREGHDFRTLRPRHPVIRSWSLFYPGTEGFYPFRPAPHLAARIAALSADFDKTVGVHIRRTDHKPAIAHSPTDLFIARMDELVQADPETRFFLASDSPEETARLDAAFPGRIRHAAPQTLARNAREGIEGAVIDLFTLAATQRVLGSFASTFSQAASLLGAIPCEIMVRTPPKVIDW